MKLEYAVIAVYLGLFGYHCWKSRQWHWLAGAVVLWLGMGALSASVLPWITGIPLWRNAMGAGVIGAPFIPLKASLLQPYFFVTFASLFFMVNHWCWHRKLKIWFADPRLSAYLIYLAISGLLLHLSYLIVLLAAVWTYPNGVSIWVCASLLQLYLLSPISWIGLQWTLMALFWVWRRLFNRGRVVWFTTPLLQGTVLAALMMMVAWVLRDMLRYFYH